MSFAPIITVTLNPAIDRVLRVEHLRLGEHQLGEELWRVAAGKGLNVSKALARLGVPSIATGFVGRDNGAYFESLLRLGFEAGGERDLAARINLQFLEVPGLTRENVTLIDAGDRGETHIRDRGPPIGERDLLRLRRKLDLMSRPGALVIFGGGLPPGLEPEPFAQMVHVCIHAGAQVVVDSSHSALAAVRDQKLLIVKPNREELADLLGRAPRPGSGQAVAADPDALLSAGRELAERFPYVLISLGADGALAFHDNCALRGRVAVDPARVVSTVGCGDCLLAGLVAALAEGEPFERAFARALAVATANVTRGAPADFDPATVREFLAAADVQAIEA